MTTIRITDRLNSFLLFIPFTPHQAVSASAHAELHFRGWIRRRIAISILVGYMQPTLQTR
jgi:hypothetical protein